ncbi:hypothetical protein E4U53_002458 [Claviceps sorghi]|nr:hypothetical protein E4U53_002458 [Claviceps sorghi]
MTATHVQRSTLSASSAPPATAAHPPLPAAPVPVTVQRRSMPPKDKTAQPVKKQSKWSSAEDSLIIELRGYGMKWEDVSKHLPGRSAISCRLHYQNYLERRSSWDEERKNKLARLYERFKAEMWAKVAEELVVPWRAAEAMHWQLGEIDMAKRAGVVPFTLAVVNHEGSRRTTSTRRTSINLPRGAMTRKITPSSPRTMYSSRHQSVSSMPTQLPPGVDNAGLQQQQLQLQLQLQQQSPLQPPQPPPPPPPPHPSHVGQGLLVQGALTEHGGDFFYSAGSGGQDLAPIKHRRQPRNPGTLPSLAELTTGVSPYSSAIDRPHAATTNMNAAVKHAVPLQPPQGYQQHTDQTRVKRRASPELTQQELNRRRRRR